MSWETDQLFDQMKRIISNKELEVNTIRSDLFKLQTDFVAFQKRAEPFIKTMELITPKEVIDGSQIPP